MKRSDFLRTLIAIPFVAKAAVEAKVLVPDIKFIEIQAGAGKAAWFNPMSMARYQFKRSVEYHGIAMEIFENPSTEELIKGLDRWKEANPGIIAKCKGLKIEA